MEPLRKCQRLLLNYPLPTIDIVVVEQAEVKTSTAIIDFTQPSSGQVSRSRCVFYNNVLAGGSIGSTGEGNNIFMVAEGEVVFTPNIPGQ